MAPIAAASDVRTAFVISFSGPVASFAEVNRFADMERLRRRGFSPHEIEAAGSALDRLDDYVRRGGDEQEFARFLRASFRQRWAPLTSLTRAPPTAEERRTWLRWRAQDIDISTYWRQVRAPVLALFGSRDEVVPVQLSVSRLKGVMAGAGNRDLTIRIFQAGHAIEHQPGFIPTMLRWARLRARSPAQAACS